MNKNKFIKQGIALALIGIAMRSGNIFFRSYLSQKIGADGMGLYQLIFSIFILAVTLSTSGISLAVTRIISSYIAKGKNACIRSAVNKCLLFCLSLSLIISFVFLVFSDFLAVRFLGNINASSSLKILGIGLPFMSICTCSKGYFLAVDEGVSNAFADVFEQVLTIGGTIFIFTFYPFDTIEQACFYAMIASTVGEIGSFLINIICIRVSVIKKTPKNKEKSTGVFKSLTHIALPCTFSSAARSLLSSCENLLIPFKLQHGGFSYTESMKQYGLLHGMTFPLLYFPSAFVAPFAVLLIPKICKEKELSHKKAVAYVTSKAVATAFSFGLITAGTFFIFGSFLGEIFYQNKEIGFYISILAPLIPLMYLDIVVDCLLKGLDQQLNSMKYNIIDSCLRIALIYIFMSRFGIKAYIAIIFFSTIFNATLSISKVIRVAKPKFDFFRKLFYQIPAMIISVYFATFFKNAENKTVALILCLGFSYLIYATICTICAKMLEYFKTPMYNKKELF